MFTVEGFINGRAYRALVGVDPSRANDGVVAGDPYILGLLKKWEGVAMRPDTGMAAITDNPTTSNPAWVMACLHAETEVRDVDGDDAPAVGARVQTRRRRAGAVQ